jgi:putative transposase
MPLPATNRTVGVDVGIVDLVITSDGLKTGNPRFFLRDLRQLKRAQQSRSRKRKGSRNREKARIRVARIHARIADRRRDFTHKLSTKLIRENQAVFVENLAVKNMVRNRSLARSIAKVDRFLPSSKTCSDCGHVLGTLPLDVRTWRCPVCDSQHDRDINAARNIHAAGLAVSACGGDVRLNGGSVSLSDPCEAGIYARES